MLTEGKIIRGVVQYSCIDTIAAIATCGRIPLRDISIDADHFPIKARHVEGFHRFLKRTGLILRSVRISGSLEQPDAAIIEFFKGIHAVSLSECGENLAGLEAWGVSLRRLALRKCPQVVELPQGLDYRNLTELEMTDCTSLSTLPHLPRVKNLNLSKCTGLRDITFVEVMPLEVLNLSECLMLRNIDPIESLTELRTLHLEGCLGLSGDFNINSPHLRHIHLGWCSSLARLCALPDTVELVKLRRCNSLTDISALYACSNITDLDLWNCQTLGDVSVLRSCLSLKYLNLGWCWNLIDITALGACSFLQDVNLADCVNLQSIESLGRCHQLIKLCLTRCIHIVHIDALGNCRKLDNLDLRECPQISNLTALGHCALTSLNIGGCSHVKDLRPLARCSELGYFALWGCPGVDDISPLARCTKLTKLNCNGCVKLTSVEALGACVEMKELNLGSCHNLTNISTLGSCPLTRLELMDCGLIKSLPACPKLKSLDLWECNGLTSIDPLKCCTDLQSINLLSKSLGNIEALAWCESIQNLNLSALTCRDLSPLKYSSALKVVRLSRCRALCDICALSCCPLEQLSLWDCPNLTKLPVFQPVLRQVDMVGCNGLVDVKSLSGCPSLSYINLTDSTSLIELEIPLAVEKLNLTGCVAINRLPIIPRRLLDLDLHGCVAITSIREVVGCGVRKLDLRGCSVLDLRPAASCAQLQQLFIGHIQGFIDVSPIAECPLLRFLYLDGCENQVNQVEMMARRSTMSHSVSLQIVYLNNSRMHP